MLTLHFLKIQHFLLKLFSQKSPSDCCLLAPSNPTSVKILPWQVWERIEMQNLSEYPHLFWKKGTEAAQKEVKEIIAGLNHHTFYLWAEGQLTAGEYAGPSYWNSGVGLHSCPETAVNQQPMASQSGTGFCQGMLIRYRSSFVCFNCTPCLVKWQSISDSRWQELDKNLKQMATFQKINLDTNKNVPSLSSEMGVTFTFPYLGWKDADYSHLLKLTPSQQLFPFLFLVTRRVY